MTVQWNKIPSKVRDAIRSGDRDALSHLGKEGNKKKREVEARIAEFEEKEKKVSESHTTGIAQRKMGDERAYLLARLNASGEVDQERDMIDQETGDVLPNPTYGQPRD